MFLSPLLLNNYVHLPTEIFHYIVAIVTHLYICLFREIMSFLRIQCLLKKNTFIQLVIGCAGSQFGMRDILLWCMGSLIVVRGLSSSMACEDFSDQGSGSCPLHCKTDSSPLNHQGNPWCSVSLAFVIPMASQILDVQSMNIINTVRKELLTLDILIPVNVQWMARYLLKVSLLKGKGNCLNTLQVDCWEEPITCNHIHNLTKWIDFSLKLIHANPLLRNIKTTYSYIQIPYILDFTIINFILFSF